MSIQTELNRINTAVSNQTNLLAQIQTALEGKVAGGGGGGELQYVTDAFTLANSGAVASGTVVGTVTGLAFKPKHVVVWMSSDPGIYNIPTTARNNYVFLSAQVGFVNSYSYSRPGSVTDAISADSSIAALTISDDGFSLLSNSASFYIYGAVTYKYLAIG